LWRAVLDATGQLAYFEGEVSSTAVAP